MITSEVDAKKISHKMQGSRTRGACNICDTNPQNCEVVTNYFTKRKMTEGYQFMYTIPGGACNVTIIDTNGSGNSLALRWKHSREYFLNGDWVVKGSGNYSAGQNSFTYSNPKDNSNHSGQWIKFSTQLTQAVDVDLIYQSENKDVKFSYLLPPFIKNIAGEQDKNLLAGTFWICGSQIMFGDTFMCTSLFFS